MIIANGSLRFLYKTGSGGIDATTGYAIERTETEGMPIPCQYSASKMSFVAQNNGEAITNIGYTILCEHLHPRFFSERLKLYDGFDRCLGEFSVKSIEPLVAVCLTRITV